MAGVDRAGEAFEGFGEARWILVSVGVLSAVTGVIVLAKPAIALTTLAVITGIFLLIDGLVETAISLVRSGDSGESWL